MIRKFWGLLATGMLAFANPLAAKEIKFQFAINEVPKSAKIIVYPEVQGGWDAHGKIWTRLATLLKIDDPYQVYDCTLAFPDDLTPEQVKTMTVYVTEYSEHDPIGMTNRYAILTLDEIQSGNVKITRIVSPRIAPKQVPRTRMYFSIRSSRGLLNSDVGMCGEDGSLFLPSLPEGKYTARTTKEEELLKQDTQPVWQEWLIEITPTGFTATEKNLTKCLTDKKDGAARQTSEVFHSGDHHASGPLGVDCLDVE